MQLTHSDGTHTSPEHMDLPVRQANPESYFQLEFPQEGPWLSFMLLVFGSTLSHFEP